ncbi:MAG: hypothetical protein JWO38_2140 [Gemmataceae bacterium]|nr:hypothetical protein [Gemmataceae bacterium]
MSLRTRLNKLQQVVGDRPPPGQLGLIVAVPVGCDMAEGRPPGVYYPAGGGGPTVVFAGSEPDPVVLDPLRVRLAPWGLLIVGHPGEIPPSDELPI